jgi:hypothetical protein
MKIRNSEHRGNARENCERLIHELANSPAKLADLRVYAQLRLIRLYLPPTLREDIVQKAFFCVLQGLESEREGRRPRPEEMASSESFKKYMHRVIYSLIEAVSRCHQVRVVHVPIAEAGLGEGSGGAVVASKSSTIDEVHMQDLKQMLFERLRKRTPGYLRPTIDAWEEVFLSSERIPTPGPRRYATEVRQAAAKIVRELGIRSSPCHRGIQNQPPYANGSDPDKPSCSRGHCLPNTGTG